MGEDLSGTAVGNLLPGLQARRGPGHITATIELYKEAA